MCFKIKKKRKKSDDLHGKYTVLCTFSQYPKLLLSEIKYESAATNSIQFYPLYLTSQSAMRTQRRTTIIGLMHLCYVQVCSSVVMGIKDAGFSRCMQLVHKSIE